MDTKNRSDDMRSDEAFAELLSKAPPRATPPPEVEADIRQAIHGEWRRVAGHNVRRRKLQSFAMAATVLLGVFVTLNMLRTPLPDFESLQMATIERQFGSVFITKHGTSSSDTTTAVEGGDIVETGADSGSALAWHGGGSLRIDENTVVAFEAENRIYLQRGRVYFDSVDSGSFEERSDAGEFLIRTDDGLIRHIGTQYMTAVTTQGTTVAVREGSISIAGAQGNRRAGAGEQLLVSADGEFEPGKINGYDEDWQWIQDTTPTIELDGWEAAQALNWVSRETGLSVRFASPSAEQLAEQTRIKGFIIKDDEGSNHLQPIRALEIFMPLTDLHAAIDGGVIIVSEAQQ